MKFVDRFLEENNSIVLGIDSVKSIAILVVYLHGTNYISKL